MEHSLAAKSVQMRTSSGKCNKPASAVFERGQYLNEEKAVPILNEFKKLLDTKIEKVPPKSLLGKAISYTLDQWHRLILYTEDGRVQ